MNDQQFNRLMDEFRETRNQFFVAVVVCMIACATICGALIYSTTTRHHETGENISITIPPGELPDDLHGLQGEQGEDWQILVAPQSGDPSGGCGDPEF